MGYGAFVFHVLKAHGLMRNIVDNYVVMAERKRKERPILSFFPKRSKGETTETSTEL